MVVWWGFFSIVAVFKINLKLPCQTLVIKPALFDTNKSFGENAEASSFFMCFSLLLLTPR